MSFICCIESIYLNLHTSHLMGNALSYLVVMSHRLGIVYELSLRVLGCTVYLIINQSVDVIIIGECRSFRVGSLWGCARGT
jgi:hypothetical protein